MGWEERERDGWMWRLERDWALGVLGIILHADRRAELGLKLLYYLPRTRASTQTKALYAGMSIARARIRCAIFRKTWTLLALGDAKF